MSINKLVFLGPPRTATNSIYYSLKYHPKIATPENKEHINHSWKRVLFPEGYMREFMIKRNTEVLLDGTPGAYTYHHDLVKRIVHDFDFDTKIIYPVRNPFDRIYSNIKQCIVTDYIWKNKWGARWNIPFIKNGIVDGSKILDFLPHSKDSDNLYYALKITNDIFIFRLDQINMNEIFEFIGIEPIDVNLKVTNQMNKQWFGNDLNKVRMDIEYHWHLYRKEIAQFIKEELYKIKKYVYVGDWIEEANNILIDV